MQKKPRLRARLFSLGVAAAEQESTHEHSSLESYVEGFPDAEIREAEDDLEFLNEA